MILPSDSLLVPQPRFQSSTWVVVSKIYDKGFTKFYRMQVTLFNYLTIQALMVQKDRRTPDPFGIPECCFNYCMSIIFI
jgi:hypothetical protein